MSKRRVVVTGLGAVTPIGNNVETFWKNIKAGEIGIGEITRFDTTDFKVKLAAEVKDFNAKDWFVYDDETGTYICKCDTEEEAIEFVKNKPPAEVEKLTKATAGILESSLE